MKGIDLHRNSGLARKSTHLLGLFPVDLIVMRDSE